MSTPDYTKWSPVELDDEIMRLEDQLDKNPTPELYQKMSMLMKLSNSKSAKKNKWPTNGTKQF